MGELLRRIRELKEDNARLRVRITELEKERNLSRQLCQEALRQGAVIEAKLERLISAEDICRGTC